MLRITFDDVVSVARPGSSDGGSAPTDIVTTWFCARLPTVVSVFVLPPPPAPLLLLLPPQPAANTARAATASAAIVSLSVFFMLLLQRSVAGRELASRSSQGSVCCRSVSETPWTVNGDIKHVWSGGSTA